MDQSLANFRSPATRQRTIRRVTLESGGKHPLVSTELIYLQRKLGGRGLKSVEEEQKLTKVKVAVKIYGNQDPVIEAVRRYEEKPEDSGRRILTKVAQKNMRSQAPGEGIGLKTTIIPPHPAGKTD